MSRNNIKQELEEMKTKINKKILSSRTTIFEKIELYTKTLDSSEYKNFKKAVIMDPKCDPTLYLDNIPYTKRDLFKHLIDMELNYFDKLRNFVNSGNE